MTKAAILEYLRSHKEQFHQKYAVERIGLFGSYARDEATDTSDIDLFVEMKPDLFSMIGLKQEIEEALSRPVDIVRNHKHIKPLLYEMIKKDITYV